MDTNKMREQFEAWADSEGYVMDCVWCGEGNHGYEDEDTQYAWGLFQHAWQASREAVAIDLSMLAHQHDEGPLYYRVDDVHAAIEAQGLKVAP